MEARAGGEEGEEVADTATATMRVPATEGAVAGWEEAGGEGEAPRSA